jgi:hypothetical protein
VKAFLSLSPNAKPGAGLPLFRFANFRCVSGSVNPQRTLIAMLIQKCSERLYARFPDLTNLGFVTSAEGGRS